MENLSWGFSDHFYDLFVFLFLPKVSKMVDTIYGYHSLFLCFFITLFLTHNLVTLELSIKIIFTIDPYWL